MSFEAFTEKFLSELPQNDPLLVPSLRLLSDSEYIEVAFVPTLPALLAMLSIYDGYQMSENKEAEHFSTGRSAIGTLALLFPLQLHEDTASNSAQGLSCTIASAVDASIRVNERLIIVEPIQPITTSHYADEQQDENLSQEDDGMPICESLEQTYEQLDPWDRHVPILNITSSRFGAGERGWVGRTVALKTVAKQWCTFGKVEL
jgi:hypothetical protein